MRTRTVIWLCIAALVLVSLAWHVQRKTQLRARPPRVGQPAFPGLNVNAATRIRIVSGTATTELVRAEAGWQVASSFGYPADFDAIRDLARELGEMKIGQVVSATDEQLKELELDPASQAPRVSVYDAQDRLLVQIQAGKMFTGAAKRDWSWGGPPQGRYVRISDGEVALVGSTLDFLERSAADWLFPRFARAPSYEITALDVTGPGRAPLHLSRASSGSPLEPTPMPERREPNAAEIERIAGALDGARFENVANPALSPAETGLDQPFIWHARLESGQSVTVRLGKTPDGSSGRFASISVAYEAPTGLLAQAQADATSTNETARQRAEEQLKKIEADRREAEELQELVSRWTYVLSPDMAEAMLLTIEQITKPIGSSETAPPDAASSPAPAESGDTSPAQQEEVEEHSHG